MKPNMPPLSEIYDLLCASLHHFQGVVYNSKDACPNEQANQAANIAKEIIEVIHKILILDGHFYLWVIKMCRQCLFISSKVGGVLISKHHLVQRQRVLH